MVIISNHSIFISLAQPEATCITITTTTTTTR